MAATALTITELGRRTCPAIRKFSFFHIPPSTRLTCLFLTIGPYGNQSALHLLVCFKPSHPSGLIKFTASGRGWVGRRNQALLGCRGRTSPRSVAEQTQKEIARGTGELPLPCNSPGPLFHGEQKKRGQPSAALSCYLRLTSQAAAASATSARPRSASFRLSISLLLSDGAAAQAVLVALPDLVPDIVLDPLEGFLQEFLGIALFASPQQWGQDVGLGPGVELFHIVCFLFGHCFVPFGKLEFFGSGQLALLATVWK